VIGLNGEVKLCKGRRCVPGTSEFIRFVERNIAFAGICFMGERLKTWIQYTIQFSVLRPGMFLKCLILPETRIKS
jgi:hypothetical protein